MLLIVALALVAALAVAAALTFRMRGRKQADRRADALLHRR
jgi:type II secretory pathway pseudopilin PulG